MNHQGWMLKRQMSKRKCKYLRNLLWHYILKLNKSEMILLIMHLNKKLLKKAQPIYLNKLRLPIKLLLKKKLKLKINQMRFLE